MQNNSIILLWNSMSNGCSNGITKRLLPIDAPLRIYGTYKHPENLCGIAFSFSKNIKIAIDSFKNLKELSIQLLTDTSFNEHKLLVIQLLTNTNKDVFACLCDNLIKHIQQIKTEQLAVKEVVNRLEKWKTLFEKNLSEGLTFPEQLGLYGELVFLDKLLKTGNISNTEVLKSWAGPNKAIRDFQGNGWAVEIKTISTNNTNQITINGKRQLDETLLNKLYLYILSVEVSQMNGKTLNEKIDELRELLFHDTIELNNFNTKLIEVGYYDSQRPLYEERHYKQRSEKAYIIKEDFPRILEKELRPGINDVNYTINVSAFDKYLIKNDELFKYIIGLYHE